MHRRMSVSGVVSVRTVAVVLGLLTFLPPMAKAEALPEPGPEDGGLRLRLVVKPRAKHDKEGFDVRIDGVNTSDRAIRCAADGQARTPAT